MRWLTYVMPANESYRSFGHIWRSALGQRGFLLRFVPSLALLVVVLTVFTSFLGHVERRQGVELPDPILPFIEPRDVTWATFGIIYGGLLGGLLLLGRHPSRLLLALQSYIIMVLLRMAAMYVVPLDPPAGMILLRDPVVEIFGTGQVLTRDLFFSGHTATLVILALAAPGTRAKLLFILGAAAVGLFLLVQHVHYTADVLVAPFVSYASYRIALPLSRGFSV